MFREAHHETLLDSPTSLVNAYIELYMDLDKKVGVCYFQLLKYFVIRSNFVITRIQAYSLI